MSDPNKGKYQKIFKREFTKAQEVLTDESGLIEWGNHDYEAFIFYSDKVRLTFYPHKTTAGNYHIRIRGNGSKDPKEANRLMKKLDDSMPTFHTFMFKELK